MRLSVDEKHLFASCMLAAVCLAGCFPPPPTVTGEVRARRSADTLTVDYELVPDGKDGTVDSVSFGLGEVATILESDSILFSRLRDASDGYQTRKVEKHDDSPHLKGSLTYHVADSGASQFQISLYTSGGFWSERLNPVIESYPFEPPNGYGLLFGLGYSSWDRLRGRDQTFVTQDMDGVDLAFGGIAYRESLTATLIGSIRGGYDDVHDLTVMDLSLGGRYQFGGRDRMWPGLCGAILVNAVRTLHETDSITTGSPGLSTGIFVESKYERLSYTYNTHFGGFHKCEVLFAFAADPRGKVGTMYTYSNGKEISEFRVGLYMEGMTSAARSPMNYAGQRSVLQKTLSAGLFAPFYLLFEMLDQLDTDD